MQDKTIQIVFEEYFKPVNWQYHKISVIITGVVYRDFA